MKKEETTKKKNGKKNALEAKTVKSNLPAFIAKILDDGKANNILSINLTGKTSLTDYLVIASGTSSRHVLSLANTLNEKLKEAGYCPKIDGKQGAGEWVILDVGDVIVHIFQPETRSFYEIEALWGEKTPII